MHLWSTRLVVTTGDEARYRVHFQGLPSGSADRSIEIIRRADLTCHRPMPTPQPRPTDFPRRGGRTLRFPHQMRGRHSFCLLRPGRRSRADQGPVLEQPSYDQLMAGQIATARAKSGPGEFAGTDTWEVVQCRRCCTRADSTPAPSDGTVRCGSAGR
jgi:hypothetical protein